MIADDNNYEIFNERHDHSSFYINPPKNDQSLYWKKQNEKLKNVMAKFYPQSKISRKNKFVKFSPDGKIFTSDNSSSFKITTPTEINKKDYFFIEKLSSLVKEKTEDIAKIQVDNSDEKFLAKTSSRNITKRLENIYDELVNESKNLINNNNLNILVEETRSSLILWLFFEYFIVNYGDTSFLLTIKENIYKFILKPDSNHYEIFSRADMRYQDKDFVNNQIIRLKGHIRICDFVEMGNTFLSICDQFINKEYYQKKFYSTYREFALIFEILGNFSLEYAKKIESKYLGDAERENIRKNVDHMLIHCKELTESIITNSIDSQEKDSIDEVLEEIHQFLEIFSGDLNTISGLSENKYEYILMSIYFRFPIKNFYYELRQNLNIDDDNVFENILFSMIKFSPTEFYLIIRNEIPKWLQFHFMDILNDLDYLPKNIDGKFLDGMSLRMYDYTDFLNYLVTLDIEFEDFRNYSLLYESGDENDLTLNKNLLSYMEIIVFRSLNKRFREFEENKLSSSELYQFVMTVLLKASEYHKSEELKNSIIKLSFEKFLHYKLYHYAIETLISYNDEREYYSQYHLVDKLFHIILLEDDINENFQYIMDIQRNERDEKVSFLISLVSFYNLLKSKSNEDYSLSDLQKIRSFFEFCFIEEKCPKVMWLWVVKVLKSFFKSHYEFFADIKSEDYRTAYDNMKNSEFIIKAHMKHLFKIYEDEGNSNLKIDFNSFKNSENKDLDAYLDDRFFKLSDFLFKCHNRSFSQN